MLDNSDSIVLEHLIKFHADLRVFFCEALLDTDLVSLKKFSQN